MKWLTAILLMTPFVVLAAPPMNVGLSWNYPTEREDGTALALSELELFRLECGVSSGQYQLSRDYAPIPGTPTLSKETIMADLNLTFDVEYWCVASVRDTGGRASVRSNEINFLVPEPVPANPGAPVLRVE